MRAGARSKMSIALLSVAEQRFAGRRMQRHKARLAELAL
jgi:hypothetical protein